MIARGNKQLCFLPGPPSQSLCLVALRSFGRRFAGEGPHGEGHLCAPISWASHGLQMRLAVALRMRRLSHCERESRALCAR